MVARVDSRLRNRFYLLHARTKTSGSAVEEDDYAVIRVDTKVVFSFSRNTKLIRN
jgi:hypothetical protein